MPYLANNRKSARTIGVKLTLIPLTFLLLFAGTIITASDNPRKPTEERQATLLPNNSRLLSSLRFWDRDKIPPQPVSPVPDARPPARLRETSPAIQNPSAAQLEESASQYEETTGAAPVPPPNPFLERKDVALAATPTANVYEPDTPELPEAKVRPTIHSSYSFDAREWVEYFPLQEQNTAEKTSVAIQTTSLRTPVLSITDTAMRQPPVPNSSLSSIGEENQWNGQAVTLETSAAAPAFPKAAAPKTAAEFDLSPSYLRRLPHTQTCGVVVVQANFPLTEIAAILDEINLLQYDLNRYVGVPAPQEKIELCLFKDEASYNNFLKEFFPKAPRDRRALYIKLDKKPGTVLVQKTKDFEIDLRHEMTHAIVHASIPKVPIWLDEGLAKYFEVPVQDRANNHQYMASTRRNAKLGMMPSLDRLVKLETIDDMGIKEYRDSWAWVHFLIHYSPDTHQLLAFYLHMLSFSAEDFDVFFRNDGVQPITIGRFAFSVGGRVKPEASVPLFKHYLDGILPNQRAAFKEHFDR